MATFAAFTPKLYDCVDLAVQIHGDASIDLPGFAAQDAQAVAAWTHPTIALVRPMDNVEEALASLAADRRCGRIGAFAATTLVAIACYCLGMFTSTLQAWRVSGTPATSLAWTPVEVREAGLVISTTAGRVLVPLGGKLPNGDVVLSVQPARRVAVLSSAALVIPERPNRP